MLRELKKSETEIFPVKLGRIYNAHFRFLVKIQCVHVKECSRTFFILVKKKQLKIIVFLH